MLLAARRADRPDRAVRVLQAGGIGFIAACLVLGAAGGSPVLLAAGVGVFVLAIAMIEPVLPALASRIGAGKHRGAAMGAYHMSQFLGTFGGGLVGGIFITRNRGPLFLGAAVLVVLWLAALRAGGPHDLTSAVATRRTEP